MSTKTGRLGLTKEYLRYAPAGSFNLIASPNCNVQFVTLQGEEGRFVAVGACEHVIIWDLKQEQQAQVLSGERSPVTYIRASPDKKHLAAGYADGTVHVYDLKTAEIASTFLGHEREISTLAFDSHGVKLASGSKDNEIVVWDMVAETGICRLSGHTAPITQTVFMNDYPILISASKDKTVKFWDLDTQHNFKTLVGHQSEVWGLALVKEDQYLVTGCADVALKVWKLTHRSRINKDPLKHLAATMEMVDSGNADDPLYPLQCHIAGSLLRAGKGRVVSLYSDRTGTILGCHGSRDSNDQLELFQFLSDEETKNRVKKRMKRQEKQQKEEPMETDENQEHQPSTTPNGQPHHVTTLQDEVKRLTSVELTDKPKSFDLVLGERELRVCVSFDANTLKLYRLQTQVKHAEVSLLKSIHRQGHRGEVRAVAISSDNMAIVSGSADSIMLWNRTTLASARSVRDEGWDIGYVVSLMFGPGDRHVFAGLKTGGLLIFDISVGTVIEEIPAHTSGLYAICQTPDQRECVTGGGDKTVKFWRYTLVEEEGGETRTRILSLRHIRTLKVDDDVLCVKVSPNGKFLAAGLSDHTIKIFFVDTLKFYLSLYGHKMPVLCMDISADSSLIATGSADRNIKIWGMDHGDCHKSIFAHDQAVTGLQFVGKTHYLFTCGKDGLIKEWDAKKFNRIQTLPGHIGEARALAVSPNGEFVVTCGADRLLRMHRRTEEILVLRDEQEEEREQQEALATGEKTTLAGRTDPKNLTSKKTIGCERATENLLECLELCKQFKEEKMTQPLPMMQALGATTTDDFLMETIRRIRLCDMEQTMMLIPFNFALELLETLPNLMAANPNYRDHLYKMAVLLIKFNLGALDSSASGHLIEKLRELKGIALQRVSEQRDHYGQSIYPIKTIIYKAEATYDAITEFGKSARSRPGRRKAEKRRIVF